MSRSTAGGRVAVATVVASIAVVWSLLVPRLSAAPGYDLRRLREEVHLIQG